MPTLMPARAAETMPSILTDFFKPWNELFDGGNWGRTLSTPAVNITEEKDKYKLSLAVPGMKKDDFKIDIDANLLTISCEKEEERNEDNTRYTRKEYNYSSFSRTFTLPEMINKDKIEAKYEDGVLKVSMPFDEKLKKNTAKQIAVK